MEKQLKEIIRSVVKEDFMNEMSRNDVHVKEIMKFYDKGSSNAKKALSLYLLRKPNATRNQILDELGDYGYNDVWEVMDHFKLTLESVTETTLNEGFGDSIKKIRSLAIKMASTKYNTAKSHLNIDKIASADKFDGSDAMNKATSALLQQNDLDEDLKTTINNLAVKLGTGATMLGIITALVSMAGWIQYLDSSFTKWYYTEIQKLAEPEVMKVMQDMGSAGQAEGSIYAKFGMYAFFIFFTIAVISLVAARMTQKPKNEYVDDKGVEHVAASLPQTEEEPVNEVKLNDLVNTRLSIEVGSGKTTGNWSNEELIEKLKEAIKHNLFDREFYYNWTDLGKEYNSIFEKETLSPMIKNIDRTLKEFFVLKGSTLVFRLEGSNAQKWIDKWFQTKKSISNELKSDYYSYRKKYAGVTLKESVNEALVKGKTYGGSKCEGGCFMGKEGLKKILKISKESPNNVFMFRDDNYSGLQPHFIKNGVIAKANTIGNPSYDLDRHKVRNLNIGKDVILSIRLFESVNECKTC